MWWKNKKSYHIDLDNEIKVTAQIMAEALLIEKFIQGIPVVGAVGGIIKNSVLILKEQVIASFYFL